MTTHVVRLFDGFDHEWMDVTEPMSKADADAKWNELTENGTKMTSYSDIDYYKVYPVDTKMFFASASSAEPEPKGDPVDEKYVRIITELLQSSAVSNTLRLEAADAINVLALERRQLRANA